MGEACARAIDSGSFARRCDDHEGTHRLVRSRHMADGEEVDDFFQFQCGL